MDLAYPVVWARLWRVQGEAHQHAPTRHGEQCLRWPLALGQLASTLSVRLTGSRLLGHSARIFNVCLYSFGHSGPAFAHLCIGNPAGACLSISVFQSLSRLLEHEGVRARVPIRSDLQRGSHVEALLCIYDPIRLLCSRTGPWHLFRPKSR